MISLSPSILTASCQGYRQRNSTTVRETLHRTLVHLMSHYIIAVSAVFIEQRRRALKRFLLLVVRHPILAKDDVTKIFLSAAGQVRKIN